MSFDKLHYDLRPCKQVQRRMIMDALLKLAEEGQGFSISNYKYTGMGAKHFVDFILFHKFLNINNLRSVEKEQKHKIAFEFNKPFDLIKMEYCDVGLIMEKLEKTLKHLIWLDFDKILNSENTSAIQSAAGNITHRSILLISVCIENPFPHAKPDEVPEKIKDRLKNNGVNVNDFEKIDFSEGNFKRTTVKIIAREINDGLTKNERNLEFFPLFNFTYSDGLKIATVGGVFVNKSLANKLQTSQIFEKFPFLRSNFSDPPYNIQINPMTKKEKVFLDSIMPSGKHKKTIKDTISKEVFDYYKKEFFEDYKEIYKYYPSYAELLIN